MSEDILELTAQIVSSHVTKSPVPVEELPTLTREVLNPLSSVGKVSTGAGHLMNAYDLTTDQYRTKWGLPPQYPMVAPNYGVGALRRSPGPGMVWSRILVLAAPMPHKHNADRRHHIGSMQTCGVHYAAALPAGSSAAGRKPE
jgi:hypothetical protein